jgi:3-oxoacyl-[acyl-carrier-protein] synthase-1
LDIAATPPLAISHYTATSCVGSGRGALQRALQRQQTCLKPCDFQDVRLDTWIGEVADLDQVRLPAALAEFDCRNNRLALLGLEADGFLRAAQRLIDSVGTDRVGLFLGTSTSGILESELAYRRRDPASGALPEDFSYRGAQNSYSLAAFVRQLLGLSGPAHVISTACSSSAKVFCSAERMIRLGLIDAAIVGGVDSLCLTTLYGFHSLELASPTVCRPYDRDRDGLSLGEAAAFALLIKGDRIEAQEALIYLCGYGESSDAHHMSAPHPEGLGAQAAMRDALRRAAINPERIDYVNLHGTATPNNDAAEGVAVAQVLGSGTPCSSTKGITGHTLGAAGALEAVICAQSLQSQFMPGGVNVRVVDPSIRINYLVQGRPAPMRFVLSNSFGFGGSNCSLIFATRDGAKCIADLP